MKNLRALFSRKLAHTRLKENSDTFLAFSNNYYTKRSKILINVKPFIKFNELENYLEDQDQYPIIKKMVQENPILNTLQEQEMLIIGRGEADDADDDNYHRIRKLDLVKEFNYYKVIDGTVINMLQTFNKEITSSNSVIVDLCKALITAVTHHGTFKGLVCDLIPFIEVINGEIKRYDLFQHQSGYIRLCPNDSEFYSIKKLQKQFPALKILIHELSHVLDCKVINSNDGRVKYIWQSQEIIEKIFSNVNINEQEKLYECLACFIDPSFDLINNYPHPYNDSYYKATLRELLAFYTEIIFNILKKTDNKNFDKDFREKCIQKFKCILLFLKDGNFTSQEILISAEIIKRITKDFQEKVIPYLSNENKNIFTVITEALNHEIIAELKASDLSLALPANIKAVLNDIDMQFTEQLPIIGDDINHPD